MSALLSSVRFIHVLSLLMVIVSGGGGFYVLCNYDKFSPELVTSVVTIMMLGGWTAVLNFWLGSSAGSERKDRIVHDRESVVRDGDV